MSVLRIATIGTGAITHTLAEAVSRTEGIRVHAVHSRDAERGARMAFDFAASASYTDLERMLAADDIDAVYVASPNSLHLEQALAAVRAGKHVLVEKPATLTADEWMLLTAAAREAGVVLLEAMRTAYDPGFREVQRILPELGVLRRASLRFDGRSSRYDRVRAGEHVNIFDPAMGGGALRDLGVYGLHAMVALFGAPESVHGESVRIATGAEGAGAVVARYPGLVVDVSYSKITRSTLASEIQGEDATLVVDHIASPRRLVVVGGTGEREIDVHGEQHALDGEVAHFVHLIRSGEPADVDHERTLTTLRLLDALV
jgi:scyllo-inositol 2-dehydrogenase (NADP+)